MACAYTITSKDKALMYQHNIKYLARFEVLDDQQHVIDVVDGIIQGGSVSIDSTSDIRRTVSITVTPTKLHNSNMKLEEKGDIWFDKNIHMYLGVLDLVTGQYTNYSQGFYVYTTAGYSYNAQANTISLSLSDYTSMLDGSRNGQVGSLTTELKAYEENEDGTVKSGNTIHDTMLALLNFYTQKKYIPPASIEDIGDPKAYTKYNMKAQQYINNNPSWNRIPYDLTYSAGDTVLTMLNGLRDLYPNYETFFDPVTNSFTCQMIPTCESDPIILDNDFFQRILIDESTNVDLTQVKNICEVWGSVLDCDWFADSSSFANNTYSASIDKYEATHDNKEGYANGDTLGVYINDANTSRNNNFLFVGDVRCLRMISESNSSYTVVGNDSLDHSWLASNLTSQTDSFMTANPYANVVFMVGANDCLTTNNKGDIKANEDNAESYYTTINAFATKWPNATVFVVSVLPFMQQDLDADTNNQIDRFNGKLQGGLLPQIIYMNLFDTLKAQGYNCVAPNDYYRTEVEKERTHRQQVVDEENAFLSSQQQQLDDLQAQRKALKEKYYDTKNDEELNALGKEINALDDQIGSNRQTTSQKKREYEKAIESIDNQINGYIFVQGDAVIYDAETSQRIYKMIMTDTNNGNTTFLCINGFQKIPIYIDKTTTFVPVETFTEADTYVFNIKKTSKHGHLQMCAYFQGQYQIHALDVLTNGELGENVVLTDNKGVQRTVARFSKDYFKIKYNVDYINLTEIADSPFAVQKIGEILDVKSGDNFDNITSENTALENAIYYNWQNCRLTDTVSITTLLCPFLDVNMKVSYKPNNSKVVNEYIIKTIEHSLDSLTSSITMYHFYSYYNGLFSNDGTN